MWFCEEQRELRGDNAIQCRSRLCHLGSQRHCQVTIFKNHFFQLSKGFDFFSTRDCLFPGGEEGAGGVLVAEEAFYQVTLPLKGGAQTNVFFKNNFPKYRVGDPVVP